MSNTMAVILAAGRGSRMRDLTAEKPKCLLPLAGRSLLHWQLTGLRAAGLEDITVVRGYHAELLTGDFATVDNLRWESTNMVRSLLCALPTLGEGNMLVAYSDIVYKAEHVAKLSQSHEDITILYDTDWLALWSLRFSDPLSDAETFEETDGFLRDIGRKASSLAEIKGQYMGLLRFSSAGINRVREYVNGLAPEVADKLDMTSLLRGLLTNGTNTMTFCPHCSTTSSTTARRGPASTWRICSASSPYNAPEAI